jgi:hypothetical protein
MGDYVLGAHSAPACENQEQSDPRKRRDHRQLEIVDIRNDLGLPRDLGIEHRPALLPSGYSRNSRSPAPRTDG